MDNGWFDRGWGGRNEDMIQAAQAQIDRRKAEVVKSTRARAGRGGGTVGGGRRRRAVCAFVTFNSRSAKQACVEAYRAWATVRGRLLACLCTLTAGCGQPLHIRLRGRHSLVVRPAPEPSDVHFENLDVSHLSRLLRRTVSVLAALLMVLLSLAVILASKAFYAKRVGSAVADCADPAFFQACNAALNWRADVPCPGSGLTVGGQLNCTLQEVWNMSHLNASQLLPKPAGPGSLRVPMDVDLSMVPFRLLLLNGGPCRVQSVPVTGNADWIRADLLSESCTAASEVSKAQWIALARAGWADPAFVNASACAICMCSR